MNWLRKLILECVLSALEQRGKFDIIHQNRDPTDRDDLPSNSTWINKYTGIKYEAISRKTQWKKVE